MRNFRRIQEQQWRECESRIEEGFEQCVINLVDSPWNLLELGGWYLFEIECWLNLSR
jgi:hypothetical protein